MTTSPLAPNVTASRPMAHTVLASPLLLFTAGTIAWLFAVGGRWDLPLMAWLYSVLLMRFSRLARPRVAIAGVLAASVAAAMFWALQLAVPLNLVTGAACASFGVVYALPFIADRLLGTRLGTMGRLLLFPAARAACEFALVSFSPQGASYGLLAMTQADNLALLQLTAITGPYGVSFLIALAATAINDGWERREQPLVGRLRPVVLYGGLLALVLVGGGMRMATARPTAAHVTVAGVNPDIDALAAAERVLGRSVTAPAPVGADPAHEQAVLERIHAQLFEDTRRAALAGAQVVVWSENAAVLPVRDDKRFLAEASKAARDAGVWLLVADNVPGQRDETRLFDPQGRAIWTYAKAHPIPGLEPYAPGPARVPIVATPHGRIGNVICYDADFPPLARAQADILLVPGGDWPEIGETHTLKMARLRAVENGYALFRQDFNGLSAAVDGYGRVLARQDTTRPGRLLFFADLPNQGPSSLYRSIGDVFAWAACLLLGVLAIIAVRAGNGPSGAGV